MYRQSRLSRSLQLREVRIDRVTGYVLHTERTTIHLGQDRLPERLAALAKVYKLFGKRGMRKIQTVYLNLEHHLNRAVIKPYRSRSNRQVVAIR